MRIPIIEGTIDRRILINFTADAAIIQKIIPPPFRPKLYKGKAIVGICLIRLKHIRLKGFPAGLGLSSENGAHRIAVEWTDKDKIKEGVFVPRRDTSSIFNTMVGGRIFPGRHYRAKFLVKEKDENYQVSFNSADGTAISITGTKAERLNPNSIFSSMEDVSAFFEAGSIGYSPNRNKYDGLELKTYNWKIEPMNVTAVHSSFFENKEEFPEGSVQFDNALLMSGIKHEWRSVKQKSRNL